MVSYGSLCVLMGPDKFLGFYCIPMCSYGFLWVFVVPYVSFLVLMGLYGPLWVHMISFMFL